MHLRNLTFTLALGLTAASLPAQTVIPNTPEGVGVQPDVKVPASEALPAALKLIRDRAP